MCIHIYTRIYHHYVYLIIYIYYHTNIIIIYSIIMYVCMYVYSTPLLKARGCWPKTVVKIPCWSQSFWPTLAIPWFGLGICLSRSTLWIAIITVCCWKEKKPLVGTYILSTIETAEYLGHQIIMLRKPNHMNACYR